MAILRSRFLLNIVAALLLTSTLPLLALGIFSIYGYQQRSQTDVELIEKRLTDQSVNTLITRASDITYRISGFLRNRELDLHKLVQRPPEQADYLAFAQDYTESVWTYDAGGNEYRLDFPLYREVSFIDPDGLELVKSELVCYGSYPFDCGIEAASALVDVSNPRNTLFRSEDYFAQAQQLAEGEIYVSYPVGQYVAPSESYRSGPRGTGKRYQGIVRFIQPVYVAGERIGYAMLGLDTIHLMEFIAHFDPSSSRPVGALGPLHTNFTYMVANNGNTIAHPFHHLIVGVNRNGQTVELASPENPTGPGNFYQMGFISEVFPTMMRDFFSRNVNSYLDYKIEDERRALVYAVIPYETGPNYNNSFGFGALVISVRNESIATGAGVFAERVNSNVSALTQQFAALVTIAFGFVFFFALLIGRAIVAPVQMLTATARTLGNRSLTHSETDRLEANRSRSELGVLIRSFGRMARQLSDREQEIQQSLELRSRELQRLTELADRFNRVIDLDTFLETSAKSVQELTSAELVVIRLYVPSYELQTNPDPEKIVTKTITLPRVYSTPGEVQSSFNAKRVPILADGRELGEFTLYTLPKPLEGVERVFVDQVAALVGMTASKLQQLARIEAQSAELAYKNKVVLEATQIKTQFISTMSHELRTPLNAVVGYSSLMMEGIGIDAPLAPKVEGMVQRIHRNAEHLRDLVNDVLDFAKLEAGMMNLVPHRLVLRDEVGAWEAQVLVLAESKGIAFTVEFAPDLPTYIIHDRRRLTQIILNLLSNAFKFTSAGEVKLSVQRDDQQLVFKVSDTGIGIPVHQLNTIFERFRQVDGTHSRQYGGTGLGLSIVRSLVLLMRGTIQVESTPDVGSTFTVKLPIELVPEEMIVTMIEG